MPAIPASRNTGATYNWMTTAIFSTAFGSIPVCLRRHSRHQDLSSVDDLSLIHISEPTRLGMISYAVFC